MSNPVFRKPAEKGKLAESFSGERPVPNDTLYEADFFQWTQQQAEALRHAARDRANAPLDWDNLAEEIESLGRSDRRQAYSHVTNIITHLLKLGCSPASYPRAKWKQEIYGFRQQLRLVLEDSPSLHAKLGNMIAEAWPRVLESVEVELEYQRELDAAAPALAAFKRRGPFSEDEVLNARVFPQADIGGAKGNLD